MKVLLVFAFVICYVASTGEWEEIDVGEEEAINLGHRAAELVNRHMRSRYHHKLVELIKARKQVVAGMQYEVKITIRETSCAKVDKSFEEANECDFRDGSLLKYCTAKIWDKSWEDSSKYTYSCSTKPFN